MGAARGYREMGDVLGAEGLRVSARNRQFAELPADEEAAPPLPAMASNRCCRHVGTIKYEGERHVIRYSLALASIAGAFMLTAIGPASAAPDWCTTQKTFNQAEKTVCATSSLWSLDGLLNDTYQGAEFRFTHDGSTQLLAALKSSEARWVTNVRNRCGNSVSCLTNAYNARIAAVMRTRDPGTLP
jgi:uncharacterized protein YecT (DUF1311 family)